jgi:hypothetical protein
MVIRTQPVSAKTTVKEGSEGDDARGTHRASILTRPLNPYLPFAPFSPVAPVAPAAPAAPAAPVVPVAPVPPVPPVPPVAPASPVAPVPPVAPVAPVAPGDAAGADTPGAPGAPAGPCWQPARARVKVTTATPANTMKIFPILIPFPSDIGDCDVAPLQGDSHRHSKVGPECRLVDLRPIPRVVLWLGSTVTTWPAAPDPFAASDLNGGTKVP